MDNFDIPQNISTNPESISKSNYQPHWRTVFVIHGFYFDNFFGQYQQVSLNLHTFLTIGKLSIISPLECFQTAQRSSFYGGKNQYDFH